MEAPRIQLPGVEEGEIRRIGLSEYLGDAVVVVGFFRAAFGPGCSPEDCWLEELEPLDLERNVAVVGIGPDTAYSHRELADRTGLSVPLLSDAAGTAAEAFGVLGEFEGHRRIPRRSVFVLDDRGIVRYAWVADELIEGTPDVDAIRAAIDGVKSDEAALGHYRRTHDYYRYGEEEFAIASEGFEDADWELAAEAFSEARRYFEEASEAADRAHWFAASDDVAADLEAAKRRVDHHLRAAKWFADSARHYADGDDDRGDELRQDAARQRRRATDGDPLPDPGDLLEEHDPPEA